MSHKNQGYFCVYLRIIILILCTPLSLSLNEDESNIELLYLNQEISDIYIGQVHWRCSNEQQDFFQMVSQRELQCQLMVEEETEEYINGKGSNLMSFLMSSVDIEFELLLSTFNQDQKDSKIQMDISKNLHKQNQNLNNQDYYQNNWRKIKDKLKDQSLVSLIEKIKILVEQQQYKQNQVAFIKNVKAKMKICQDLCLNCSLNESDKCNQCIDGATLKYSGECQCIGYQIIGDNKCVDECPEGFELDRIERLCKKIKDSSNCVQWVQGYCSKCRDGYQISKNWQCLQQKEKEEMQSKDTIQNENQKNASKKQKENSRIITSKQIFQEATFLFGTDINQNQLSVNYVYRDQIDFRKSRLLYEQTNLCKQSDPNCLLCNSKDKCSVCKFQFYNFNGKCEMELKLIDYADNVKLIVTIVAFFLFASSLLASIASSYFNNPNSILLSTSFSLQKTSFLNLISTQQRIQTSDLFASFQCNLFQLITQKILPTFGGQYYTLISVNKLNINNFFFTTLIKIDINPFMIFKSTSWINQVLSSQENSSPINYIFNYNDVDGDIIVSSSGCMLFIFYILFIYLIFILLLKKKLSTAFEIYKKISSGLIFQLLAQGIQILFFGILLQIEFFTSTKDDASNDDHFSLKIVLLVVNTLTILIILLFLYRQTNFSAENPALQKGYSIQDVNRRVFQCDCFNITWAQRNYTLLVVIKESIIIPLLIVFLKDLFFAQLIALIALEGVHLLFSVYLRPYKSLFDNIQCILGSFFWLSIFIIKLACLILCKELEITNQSQLFSSDSISSLQRFEIALIFLILFSLVTIQLIPLIKQLWLRKSQKDNEQPLIEQIDPLRKIQLSPFGYYRENPSMFKIREEMLSQLKLKQNYKHFKGKGRQSVSTILGLSQSGITAGTPSMASFNHSPIMSPIKIWNLNKTSSEAENQNRKSSFLVLNNTGIVTNNNSFLNQSEILSKYPHKKNSITTIPLMQINEFQKEVSMNQISEQKEEYASDNKSNTKNENNLNKQQQKDSKFLMDINILNQNSFSKKSQNSSRLSYSSSSSESSGSNDSSESNETDSHKISLF